ncbi:MAG: hypothetical protein ACI8TP_002177 [Acidimicrobiales bacterium]|jgi:uncharacterized protein (DUF983 family)
MMLRGLSRACPVCGTRGHFRFVAMTDDCAGCGLHFERIEGHWIGAVGINTIVTFGLLAIVLVSGFIITFPEFPVGRLIFLGVGVSIVVPIVFHPSSRMLWTAIDLAMRPPEAGELPARTNAQSSRESTND